MPRERKPNEARIRYDREGLTAVLRAEGVSAIRAARILDTYERLRRRNQDKPCQSVVHHGPGHQGTTYCQLTGGDAGHDHVDEHGNYDPTAPPQHVADLPSGGRAEWTDDDPYADYWG